MTPIWVAIRAVGGFEMHLNKNAKKVFTIRIYFTERSGVFTQATLWRWDEEGQEYHADAHDAVAKGAGDWGKELKL